MVTIKDVAKKAGVSVATVSNILNHKSYVSNEKYERVMQVVEELNYTPSSSASNLKRNKTKLMAVIIPELSLFFGQILKGIQRCFEEAGYSLVIKCSNYSAYQEAAALTGIRELGVRGILIVYSAMKNMELYRAFQERSIPVVFLCERLDNYDFSSVSFMNEKIVYNAVADIAHKVHRAEKDGEEKIMLIAGPEEYSDERECVSGFTQAISETELSGEIYHVRSTRELAYIDLMEILQKLEEIPRWFVVSNENTVGSLQEILKDMRKESNIYVLCGEDEYPDFDNRITSICRNAANMGQTGAKLILDYNKSPIYNENSTVVLEQPKTIHENLHWKNGTKKKIALLAIEGQQSKALLKLAPFFTNEYGVEVDCLQLGYEELYNRIIEENRKERGEFDIFMLDYQLFATLLHEQYLLDLSGFLREDQDDFCNSFLPIARQEFIDFNMSGIYCLPLLTTMQLLFYRRDLFEDKNLQWHFYKRNGVELRPPKTWTEFDVISRYFTKSINPESPVKYGTTMGDFTPIAFCEQFFPRQWAYRGSLVTKGRPAMNTQGNRRALESMCNAFRCSGAVNDLSASNDSILNGDIAMCVTYATHIPCTMVDNHHKVDFSDILATHVPGNCPMLGGWALGINRFSQAPKEGYMFAKWMTSNKNMVNNTLLGGFPPKTMASDDIHINYVYPWVKDLLENFDYAKRRKDIYDDRGRIIERFKIDTMLAAAIKEMLAERRSVDETMELLQHQLEEMIYRG